MFVRGPQEGLNSKVVGLWVLWELGWERMTIYDKLYLLGVLEWHWGRLDLPIKKTFPIRLKNAEGKLLFSFIFIVLFFRA